jgi:hypothetical protein
MAANWIDLLDPNAAELREQRPRELEESAIELLLKDPDDVPRPTLGSRALVRTIDENGAECNGVVCWNYAGAAGTDGD